MCEAAVIRPKDKIEKYLLSLVKKTGGNYIETKLSRYFSIKGRVIRVSDHIGKNSSGIVSIIITSDGDYILFTHTTNKLRNISYNDLKKFCKSFIFISDMMTELTNNTFKFELDEPLTRNKKEYYLNQIETLSKQLKGMGGVVSVRDKTINSLRNEIKNLNKKIVQLNKQ